MSYNPERARNFYKTGRKRPKLNPHAGTKHSDIMKRQGLGTTVPMESRAPTMHGFAATLFEGDQFTVRSEVIGAGNSYGFGLSEEHDRLYQVSRGVLFVTVQTPSEVEDGNPGRDIIQIQAGGIFRAPKGLPHGVAASGTDDVEILVIEDAGYEWSPLEAGARREVIANTSGSTPDARIPTRHEREQSQAKKQAEAQKRERRRRKPSGPAATTNATGHKVGVNAPTNANSGDVIGVNPMPEKIPS